MGILEMKKGQLSMDQTQEISKMLSNEAIKNFETVTMEFDLSSKKVKQKLEGFDMSIKVEGMKDMLALYHKCKNYQEQLRLFGSKTKDIMRGCLSDIVNFKNNRGTVQF
jgi:hypothetical protein